MRESVELVAGGEDAGKRTDVVLARRIDGLSRSAAAGLIRDGKVTLNGRPARPSDRLRTGDRLVARLDRATTSGAEAEPIPLPIVYRDADLAVIDKPAGLVVHPGVGHRSGTVANALAHHFPQIGGVGERARPGIVHRLDKDTSGLMVVALTPAAMAALQRQIASRAVDRRYIALVGGHLGQRRSTIDAPIGRDPRDRKRMAAHGIAARMAQTSFRTLGRLGEFTLLEARLHTGRTHQIRVHFAGIGHPVAGDPVYGGASVAGLTRQFLHAHRLELESPSELGRLSFTSPLPPDLESALRSLGAEDEFMHEVFRTLGTPDPT